ncbi:alpha/beta hydrolase [Nocardia sp. NBC_01388]|uniref:alpha/beta hydrolase n=1 Tax=Nocardia sp. NBC_01388 TaxID=2903596 RepID=UPI00324D721A
MSPPWNSFLDSSLLTGFTPVALLIGGAVGGVCLVLRRNRRHLLLVVPATAAAAAGMTATITYLIQNVGRPFPDSLGLAVPALTATALLGVLLATARLWSGPRHLRHVLATTIAATVVVAAAANQVNISFAAYPTVRDVLNIHRDNEIRWDTARSFTHRILHQDPLLGSWRATTPAPSAGRITTTRVPPTRSGFPARDAIVYLPPAYFSDPCPLLPVLILLPGQPGSPEDWFTGGRLAQTMDDYAARHQGLSPVVVVADGTGGEFADPLCVDSKRGRAATYLGEDVPAWVRANLQIDPDPRAWAVGGLSYGGTCALQLATYYPGTYPTFLDFSGDSEPSLGDRRRTVAEVFGGNTAAFTGVNPVDLMARRKYPDTAGVLVAGTRDSAAQTAARTVSAAARAADMTVRSVELPGGHDYRLWRAALAQELDWLSWRLGLAETDHAEG